MTDFNAILFAQITDLQGRVSKQDVAIAALKAEVDRLTSKTVQWTPGVRTPIAPTSKKMPDTPVKGPNPRTNPKQSIPYPTLGMTDVLNEGETVYMEIRITDGTATAICSFDGTNLTVTECELSTKMIGITSAKPGEILYKFRDALVTSNLTKEFELAPWKLCFVTRNGVKKSLQELRNDVSK
jgi:hypothetical protein